MIKITLICAAGMSTSILANKMLKAAKNRGIKVKVRAISRERFELYERFYYYIE